MHEPLLLLYSCQHLLAQLWALHSEAPYIIMDFSFRGTKISGSALHSETPHSPISCMNHFSTSETHKLHTAWPKQWDWQADLSALTHTIVDAVDAVVGFLGGGAGVVGQIRWGGFPTPFIQRRSCHHCQRGVGGGWSRPCHSGKVNQVQQTLKPYTISSLPICVMHAEASLTVWLFKKKKCLQWNPDERPHWWQTILMRDHTDDRPSWWETILMRDHTDERPHLWQTTLIRDHPDERLSWWKTTLMRLSCWKTTLMRDHRDERPPWWDTVLMSYCPAERQGYEITPMRDHSW